MKSALIEIGKARKKIVVIKSKAFRPKKDVLRVLFSNFVTDEVESERLDAEVRLNLADIY